jgi:acyl-CoA synthetase (AMP-forming)/AMP-acid ligase II
MPPAPDPTSLAARAADLRGVARLARSLPLMRPGARWNPARLVARNARRWPDRLALAFEDRRYTWCELDRIANRYAQAFRRLGIERGDVVTLLMDNRPEYLFATTGLSRLRAIGALINTNVVGAGLVHAIDIGRPKLLLTGSEHASKVQDVLPQLKEIGGDDVVCQADGEAAPPASLRSFDAVLADAVDAPPSGVGLPEQTEQCCYIYTSGTTGLPKAALIPNQRMLAACAMFGHGIFEAGPGETVYCPLPLYHSSATFAGWGTALATGAALALRRKFSASRFWHDVRDFGATRFIYIGELCRYLLNQPVAPGESDHRIEIATGNGLRPDIWETFQQRFGIPLIREFYGATEGALPIVNFAGVPGRIGRLLPGQAILRCDVETGEVVRNAEGRCERVAEGEVGLLVIKIAGLSRFDGYLDEKASRKKLLEDVFEPGDRYFDSGDLLEVHAGNWLSFADRIGDTFRWKGENVSTNEVAEALNLADGVLEANVYGVEVPGSEGRAGMASLNVSDEFDLDAFARHLASELPVYQRPYFVRLQHDMRITGTFKHQKVDYRREGYDPAQVDDPLYFLDGDAYVELDAALYDAIQSGVKTLR